VQFLRRSNWQHCFTDREVTCRLRYADVCLRLTVNWIKGSPFVCSPQFDPREADCVKQTSLAVRNNPTLSCSFLLQWHVTGLYLDIVLYHSTVLDILCKLALWTYLVSSVRLVCSSSESYPFPVSCLFSTCSSTPLLPPAGIFLLLCLPLLPPTQSSIKIWRRSFWRSRYRRGHWIATGELNTAWTMQTSVLRNAV